MPRRVIRHFSFAALLVAAAILGTAALASASAPIVTNGGFETGTLDGWTTATQGSTAGEWHLYSRQGFEKEGGAIMWAPPPSGEFAAAGGNLTGSAGTNYLYQDIALPAATTDQLSMYLYYRSSVPISVPTPNTLFTSESPSAQGNQQVRVDILKSNAPLESLSPNDILATVYASKTGDPEEIPPTVVGADLSAYAGQTVRLRIADAVQDGGMQVGVDDVTIDSASLPPPTPQPQPTTAPSNDFSTGKLTLDEKHGSARLAVTLPGAGTLNVSDARRKVAIASVRADPNEKPILIRTASVETSGPQTVRVSLRPTTAAKKLLAKNGRLPFRLQMTFIPDGGMAASQGYGGTLRKKLRPIRR